MRTVSVILILLLVVLGLALAFAPRRDLHTEITIDAPPETVWAVLTEPGALARLNPAFTAISGDDWTPGARPVIQMQANGRAMTISPVVQVADAPRLLEWHGQLWVPRLFDGTHRFDLTADGNGTHLRHSEAFRGILLWFINPEDFRPDFEATNAALKAVAESR